MSEYLPHHPENTCPSFFSITVAPPSQQYQGRSPSFTVQLEALLSSLRRHIDAIEKPGLHIVPSAQGAMVYTIGKQTAKS